MNTYTKLRKEKYSQQKSFQFTDRSRKIFKMKVVIMCLLIFCVIIGTTSRPYQDDTQECMIKIQIAKHQCNERLKHEKNTNEVRNILKTYKN